MANLRLLFHVHSHHSYDSILPLSHIISYCERRIDLLIITDHDSFKVPSQMIESSYKVGLRIIPSIEYTTDDGDIIGLFMKKPCPQSNFNSVVAFIRENNGLVVLPHPMKGHRLENISISSIDLIEQFNPRCTIEQNRFAEKLCSEYNLPGITGADAHIFGEMSLALNCFEIENEFDFLSASDNTIKKILLTYPRKFRSFYSTQYSIPISQIVKGIRQWDIKLILSNTISVMKLIFKTVFNYFFQNV